MTNFEKDLCRLPSEVSILLHKLIGGTLQKKFVDLISETEKYNLQNREIVLTETREIYLCHEIAAAINPAPVSTQQEINLAIKGNLTS